jgi:hypothetical protein
MFPSNQGPHMQSMYPLAIPAVSSSNFHLQAMQLSRPQFHCQVNYASRLPSPMNFQPTFAGYPANSLAPPTCGTNLERPKSASARRRLRRRTRRRELLKDEFARAVALCFSDEEEDDDSEGNLSGECISHASDDDASAPATLAISTPVVSSLEHVEDSNVNLSATPLLEPSHLHCTWQLCPSDATRDRYSWEPAKQFAATLQLGFVLHEQAKTWLA